MMTRQEMKRRGRRVIKRHYGLLLAVCLIAAFIGTEFVSSLDFAAREDTAGNGSLQISVAGTMNDAIGEALQGNVDSGKEISEKITEAYVRETKEGRVNPAFGRSRGVLAGLLNGIDSGAFVIGMISAVRNIGFSEDAVLVFFILAAMVLWFGVWFLLINTYKVVSRRIFLESRLYDKVPVQRFLFLWRVRRWRKASCTMFMTWLFQFLWCFTIVGGIIKRYSYYLVPYIAAENPDAGWRDTILLSRRMMKGHKWECFLFEMSFLGWDLLGAVTFGLVSLFYVNSYKTASFTEYYTERRREAMAAELCKSGQLCDKYLFEKAGDKALREAYGELAAPKEERKTSLKGIRRILAEVFGIAVMSRKEEERRELEEEQKLKYLLARDAMERRAYPARLSPIPENEKNDRMEQVHYLRRYSIPSLILLYFIFAVIGWCWEVTLHLITEGEFVNRGVLHGPWLPIYGTGGVLILVLLNKLRRRPALEFLAAVILCGCVEYFTAWYLEIVHDGKKWWDYSGYFLNLHGRICAEGLLVFGIGGMAIVYLVAPLLDDALRRLKYKYAVLFAALLLLLFAADQLYSAEHPNTGQGITDYKGACLEAPPDAPEMSEKKIAGGEERTVVTEENGCDTIKEIELETPVDREDSPALGAEKGGRDGEKI